MKTGKAICPGEQGPGGDGDRESAESRASAGSQAGNKGSQPGGGGGEPGQEGAGRALGTKPHRQASEDQITLLKGESTT